MKTHLKELATTKPEIAALIEDYNYAVDRRDQNIFARARLNYRTRNCIWSGQSEDQRRWSVRNGEKQPFPWPGAFDLRVPFTDSLINEDVAMLMKVWSRMKTMAYGTESNDGEFGNRLTQILRWMKYTQMKEQRRETKLLCNYLLEGGTAIRMNLWERKVQLGYDDIDFEALKNAAQQAQQVLANPQMAQQLGGQISEEELWEQAELPRLLLDEAMDEVSVDILEKHIADVPRTRIQRIVKDLRETGHARFPRPYLKTDRPLTIALRPNDDVYVPPESSDLQESGLYRTELLTEHQLRNRPASHGWDQQWTDWLVETQRGNVSSQFQGARRVGRAGSARSGVGAGNGLSVLNTERLYEVVHAFRPLADEEGVIGIYYTCFSPNAPSRRSSKTPTKDHAYHGLLDYDHGEVPAVFYSREARTRLLDDSRGYGEIANGWQSALKAERDSRGDRLSLSTVPPYRYPPGEPPQAWGPGVGLPARDGEYDFLDTPKYDAGSVEFESTMANEGRRYFGRQVDELGGIQANNLQQELADTFLDCEMQSDQQILGMLQQYMPDEFYFRVVGSDKGKSIHATREEIQGSFDIRLGFNVDDLNPELVREKIGLMKEAMSIDKFGVTDMTEAQKVIYEWIDPNLGERLLRPQAEAYQAEIDDESNVLTQALNGIDVPVKPGQAYGPRAQWLQNTVMNTPTIQKKMQEDENVKKSVEKRFKRLTHQVEQFGTNAEIGRQGA